MGLQGWLSYLIPSGTGGTLIILGIRYLMKQRAGKLSRSELANTRAEKAERLADARWSFIELILALWGTGAPKPRVPARIRPKKELK